MRTPKAIKASAPVTERTAEVFEAGRKERMDMQKRQGFGSTLFAGNPETTNKLGGGL